MCAEYTYPESEGITAGILNVANNVYGIVLILIMGRLLEVYGDIPVHVGLCIALLIGFIMTLLTKDVQRRQDARNSVHYVGVEQSEKSNERNGLEKNWFALNYCVFFILTWHTASTFEYRDGRDVARLYVYNNAWLNVIENGSMDFVSWKSREEEKYFSYERYF